MKLIKSISVLAIVFIIQFQNVSAQIRDIEKLFLEQKYSEVLKSIDDNMIDGFSGMKNMVSTLYYMRANAALNVIYKARTGLYVDPVFDINAETSVRIDRARFEFETSENYIKLIENAISDTDNALKFGLEHLLSEEKDEIESELVQFYKFDDKRNDEINETAAFLYLEKAQFVTNNRIDFLAAKTKFEALAEIANLRKDAFVSAQMRYLVALGQINDAGALYAKATNADQSIANTIPAIVEAFDLVGNYKYCEGLLLSEAIRQITKDKGKVVPSNFGSIKNAMKLHLYNFNYASGILPTTKLLPLQRYRLSSAYMLKGKLTPAESDFIKNTPDVIIAENETPALDVLLNSVRLKLQSTNKKEVQAAKKTIDELVKNDPTNAAILSVNGYSKMLSKDFTAAETDLLAAIAKEPFLSFANGAFDNRTLVYKNLGKVDLAEKSEKESTQFKQLLAFLSATN